MELINPVIYRVRDSSGWRIFRDPIISREDLGIVHAGEIVLLLSESVVSSPLTKHIHLVYVMTFRGIFGWIDDMAIVQESSRIL